LYRSKIDVPYLAFYGYAGLLLIVSTVILYLLHLVIAFLFDSGATIGLGIFEVLVSALLLTGLGDSIWQFVPAAWPARLMGTLFEMLQYPDQNPIFAERMRYAPSSSTVDFLFRRAHQRDDDSSFAERRT